MPLAVGGLVDVGLGVMDTSPSIAGISGVPMQ